jgi:hypothetical protein
MEEARPLHDVKGRASRFCLALCRFIGRLTVFYVGRDDAEAWKVVIMTIIMVK